MPSTSIWPARTRSGSKARCHLPPRRAPGCSVSRVPLGVVGVVSPWNWPYTMGAEVFAPALGAGNTVVWVPELVHLCLLGPASGGDRQGGLPPGVFNFLPGPGRDRGRRPGRHPGVDAVGFVGFGSHGQDGRRGRRGKDPGARARGQRADGHAAGRRPRAGDRGDARGRVLVRRPKLHGRRAFPRPLVGAKPSSSIALSTATANRGSSR